MSNQEGGSPRPSLRGGGEVQARQEEPVGEKEERGIVNINSIRRSMR